MGAGASEAIRSEGFSENKAKKDGSRSEGASWVEWEISRGLLVLFVDGIFCFRKSQEYS